MNISISWSYLIRISSLLNRLYLNQPAILVGETGVGKTSFLKLIQSFINLESGDVKNEYIFHTQNVYDDFSHEQIQNILEENRNKIVFFDEFNTSSACSFILYTMLNSNRSIIAAMNPSIKTNEISKIFSPIGLPQHLIFHCDQKVLTSKAQIGQDYDIYHYKYFVYDVDINDIFIYCDPVKQSENEDDWLPDEEYQNIRHFVCSNFANSSVFFQTKEYYDGIVNQDQIVSFINIYLDCLKGTISFIRNMMNDRAAITFRDIQSSFDYLEIIFQKLIKNLSDNTLIEKVMLDSVLFTMILSFGLRFPKSFDIKGADFFAMKHIVKIINSLPNSNFTDYTSPSICNIFYTMNRSIQPCLSDNILFNKDYQQLYKITFNKENKNGYFTINSTKTIEKLISMQNVNLKISKNLLVDIILGVYEKDNNTIKILNSKEFTINDELVDLSSASFKLYIDQKLFENSIKYPNTYISYDIPNNLKLILKDFIYRNENNDDFGNRKNSELSIEFIDDMKVNLQYIFLESLNQVLKIEQSPEIIMEQFTKFIFWNEWNKLITGSQNWIIKSFLYNCFLIELCIETNNSCFIFGPPGTSKSYSIDQISKLYPNLFIFTYMCSQTSSENGLKSQFLDAATYIASKKGKAVICLEVMGHNNIRFKRTLKFLHFGLDNGINIKSNNKENVKVPCILISNYAMDFSNMNSATPIYAEPPELGEIIKAVNFSKKCYLDKTPDNCDFYKDFDKYYEKYSRFDDRDSFHCKTPERKGQAKMPEISEKSIFNILLPKNENQPIPLRPFYTVYQLLSADVKQNKIFFQIARELFVLSNFKGKSVVDLISNMKRIGQFTEDVAKHIRQPILKNSHEKRKLKKSNFLYNNIDLFYERLSNDTLSFKSLCIITTNYSYLEFIQELFDLSLDINISTLLSMKCNSQKARSKLPKIHTNNMKISPQFFISEDFKSSPDELCKYSLNQFTKLLLETNQNKKAIIVDNNPIIDSLLDLLNSNKFPNNESSNQVLLSYNGFPSLYNVNSNFYSIFVFEASTLFDNGNQIPKPFLDRLEYIYLDWSTIKYIVYYPVVTDYIKEKHVNATYQEYVNQIDSIITKILNYHEKSDNDLFVSQGNGSRRFNNQIIKNYSVDIPKFYYKDSNKLIRCNIGLHINPNNLYNYYQLNRNKSTFSFFGYQILDSYILKFSWSSGIKCVILTKSKIHDDFYRNQDIPSIIVEDNLILNANDFISYIDSEILKCKTKEIQIFVKCMNFNRLHDQHLKKLLESVTKKYYQLTIHCYILYFQCQFKDVFISTLRWPAFHMDDISVHHLFGNFTTITTEEIKDILYDLKYFDNSIIYKIIQETMKTLLLTLNNKNKYKILFEWLSNVLSSKPINLKESYIYSPCFELIKQFQISASIDCKQQQLPILSIHSQFLQQFQKQLIEFLHPFFILIKPFERNSYILNNCFSLNLSEIPFHAWKCLIQNINKSTIQEIKYTTKNKISFDLIILNNIKEMIENHCIIPFDKTTIDHQFFQSVKTFSPATEFFLFLSNNNMINLKSAAQYIIDEMRKQNSEKAQIHILSHLLHNKKLLHEMTEEIFYSEPVFSFSNDVWCFNKDNIKNELENSITPFHKCIHSLEELILNSIISKYSAFSLLQKSDVMNYLYLAYYGKTMPNIYNVENYYDLLIPFQKVLNLNTLQFMNDVLQGMIKSNKESIISCFTEANNLNLVKFLLQKPNSSDLYLKQLFLLRILDAPSITLIMENEKENKFEDSFSLCLNEIDSTLKNYILFKENDKINSKDSNEIRDFWQKNIWQNPQYLNIALDNQNIIEKYLNNQAVLIEDKQLMLYYIISSIIVKLNNSDIILSRSKITTMNSLLTLSVTNPFLIKSKIQKVSHFPDIKPEGLDHTLPEMNTEHDIKLTPGTENHTKFVLEANKTDIKIENDEITTESKTEIKSLSKVDLSLEKVDISIHDLELNDLEFLMNEIGVSQTIQNIIRENDPILSYFILDKEFDESSILIDQFLNTFKGKLITDFLIEAPKLDNRLTFLDHVESFSYGKVLDHFDEWFLQDIDGYPLIVIQLANLIKNVSNFCFVDQIRALNSILEPWLSIDAIQVNNQGYSYISLYFIKCILEGYQRMNQEMKNELNKIDDLLIILNEIVKPILMNEIFSNDAYMFIKDSNESSDISRQYCDREEEIMLMNLYRISIKPSKPNPKLLNFLSDKIQNML
ncbi:hypothetical protein TRFO_02964 [Tritrichomonas foetus]|uniref:AAA+ ATPase domain-containing protein n=1 Tax=Tritrichomonas foetus TaxID=1144522 RepID=A0A1J4KTX6_9EUKA|nr:hypothetical protein TRFO_02964 [Tritrichomonas foetus]|eukprot:OHT14715.1 hypothetical protein TRFO_02964 [Tritrichomonas foetus]